MALPPNFGFVWKNLVAGSGNPGGGGNLAGTLATLREHGFRAILSLTELPLEFALIREFGFEYLHLPIEDFSAPSPEQIARGVGFLEEQTEIGRAHV